MTKLLLIHALFSLFSAVRVNVVIVAFTPSPPYSSYSPIRRQQQRAKIVTLTSRASQTTVVVGGTTTAGYSSLFADRYSRDYDRHHHDQALYASSSENDTAAAADSPSSVVDDNSSNNNGGSSSRRLLAADIAGILASGIVLYSEFTLKTTGCGLPAGPFGLVGAAEGISYLTVFGIAAYSILPQRNSTK
jgi:hypothetical protein